MLTVSVEACVSGVVYVEEEEDWGVPASSARSGLFRLGLDGLAIGLGGEGVLTRLEEVVWVGLRGGVVGRMGVTTLMEAIWVLLEGVRGELIGGSSFME